MLNASFYIIVYLLIVSLMTFYALSQYNNQGRLHNGNFKEGVGMSLILLIVLVLFIGTRPTDKIFVDMWAYNSNYELIFGDKFYFDWDVDNLIWDNLYVLMACEKIPFSTWLLGVAFIYFGLIFLASLKLFKKDILLAFVTYLGALSTFSYGVNGMKAGVAASIFLVSIAYREKLYVSVPLAILSYGFHHSMSMVIVAYIIVLFVKNPRYFFCFWIVCLLMAALHITYFQKLFGGLTDEQGALYLMSEENSGFRPDFILYSAVPVYIGYQHVYKYDFKSKVYLFLLNLYLLTNSIWMLCMYASFNNRIAYLSWLMYPFVLLYPFVNDENVVLQGKLRRIVFGHLSFTIFMMIAYWR